MNHKDKISNAIINGTVFFIGMLCIVVFVGLCILGFSAVEAATGIPKWCLLVVSAIAGVVVSIGTLIGDECSNYDNQENK